MDEPKIILTSCISVKKKKSPGRMIKKKKNIPRHVKKTTCYERHRHLFSTQQSDKQVVSQSFLTARLLSVKAMQAAFIMGC